MRKTLKFVIDAEGRDKGKTFLLTEMFADEGEAWAMRALLGMISAGVSMPDDYANLGMAGFAEMGLKSLPSIKWETLEPLMKEMFDCVQIVVDPKRADATTRPLIREDIEEISTRLKIRMEWGKLHLGFFMAAVPSLFEQAKAAAGKLPNTKRSQK